MKNKPTYQQLSQKVTELETQLAKTQWLHENVTEKEPYTPFYGHVTKLNTIRTILDNVGKETLNTLTSELMDLLDTSVAIYEKNGDYAFGIFNSGWCQLLDAAARKLCNTEDNKTALSCGKWLCHEDCWNNSAKAAIDTKKSTDIDCIGNIKLYAEPIFVKNEVIGVINIGYGNPPTDVQTLEELARKYSIDFKALKQKALAYKPRPDFIIEIAKKRLKSIAKLIGEIVSRKQTEQALKESEEKTRYILKHNPNAIAVFDNNMNILNVSDRFLEDYNVKNKDVMGKNHYEVFPEIPPKWRKIHKRALKGEIISNEEDCFIRPDGSATYTRWECRPWFLANGEIGGMVSYTEVITERKKAEKKIQEYTVELEQANAQKDTFIQILAHDLRSPFNSLLGFSNLLLKKIHKYDIDKIERQIRYINDLAEKTYDMLEDLLLWAKAQSGKLPFAPKSQNVMNVLMNAINLLKSIAIQKQITITTNISNNLIATFDADMIRTVIRNLISNAIKFTPQSGHINIRAEVQEEQLLVSVSDTGIGIPDDILIDIWSKIKLKTTEGTEGEKGTGFGLLLCKEFIEKHEGKIWVESQVGNGATFFFTIPQKK